MTPSEQAIYDRLGKLKVKLFHLIAIVESQQSILISRVNPNCDFLNKDGSCSTVFGCSFVKHDPLTQFPICGLEEAALRMCEEDREEAEGNK
jgi:hypothetical protein